MNNQNTRIALVDDRRDTLTTVSMILRSEGYIVSTYDNGESALNDFEQNPPDLGLLDIKMPRMNGRELLIKIRSSHNSELKKLPIIFLTSKDDEQDEIMGLRLGAADYITKPYSTKLLIERIKTVIRVHNNREKNKEANNSKFNKGNLVLDNEKQLCFWKNQEVELTVAEFELVKCLAIIPGVVKNRNQLMDAMYGENIYVDDRTIDSHIKRLRRKFKETDSKFNAIRTRYSLGYKWRE